MLRLSRLSACLTIFACFIILSLLIKLLPRRVRSRLRRAVLRLTARQLLAVLGIRVTLHTLPGFVSSSDRRACLMVSNHQSYLDVAVIAAHFPARFVAKREVATWPLIGLIARLCETIFITRSGWRAGARCAQTVARTLSAGQSVQVFPEGTTTDGSLVLPFKPLLLHAALRARVPVLPLTINYVAANGQPLDATTRDLCCWHGEMEFLGHFWQLLAVRGLDVHLEAHSMIEPENDLTAQELAHRARAQVVSRFKPLALSAADEPAPAPSNREDVPAGLLVGAVLFSLLTRGQDLLDEVEYGETR